MLYWILVLGGFLVLLVACRYLLNWLSKFNIHINKWIWGALSFLVLIIPHALYQNIPTGIDAILYILCAIFAVNFMIEQQAYVKKMNQTSHY